MKYALTDVIEGLLGQPVPERAQNAMVRCPFHGDEHASMSIDLDRGLWCCFGCGEKGGLNRLARLLDTDLNEGEVLMRSLSAAVERHYEEPPDFTQLAQNLHAQAYEHKPDPLIRYMAARQLHGSVLTKFTIGWDPGMQRISMPYYEDERVTAIKYRYTDGRKDNEKGGRRYIYNVNDIRAGAEAAILCEGESDVHSAYSQLVKVGAQDRIAVVGFPGASASKSNWELYALEFLWVGRVYVAFDADEAGDKGAQLPLQVLGEKAVRVRPSTGKDLTDFFLSGGTLSGLGIEADKVLTTDNERQES